MSNNIDFNKYQKYLETIDEKQQYYVKIIVDNLIYIRTEELVDMVRRSVRKFTNVNNMYNLYVPDGKIGSEHYLLMMLKDEFKPVSVIFGTETVNNDYPILLVDDAIYSSTNMCATVDNYRYNTGCKNKFVIAVGALSTRNVQLLEDKYFNAEIIADREVPHLLPNILFNDYDYDYFYKFFKCESVQTIPVYFEHKIANEFGTYQFIKQITDIPISRSPIDAITMTDINKLVLDLRS